MTRSTQERFTVYRSDKITAKNPSPRNEVAIETFDTFAKACSIASALKRLDHDYSYTVGAA